ncbi:DUF2075 domain-containing protein [Acetobacteraceae bacterium H6797]|nr:DUF2075 domain-containing protein [Acetobacteraceae bacterium H6797]
MRAWLSYSAPDFLARDPEDIAGRLAAQQAHRGFAGTAEQQAAWLPQIMAIRAALQQPGAEGWTIALEYELLRLEKRIDAIILTDRAIFCLEFKTRDASPAALAEAEDYALDLRDFHAGSRHHPIVPVLVTDDAFDTLPAQAMLFWDRVPPPFRIGGQALGPFLAWAQNSIPDPAIPLDGAAWLAAPYRPVPNIIEAATMLFSLHGVEDIATARADRQNLTRTRDAIARAITAAKVDKAHTVIFVTGIPGAGKTLCGLNTVFGPAREDGAAFLSGNVPLVTVLREALARDAVSRKLCGKPEAERRVKTALQNVHRFLEDGATDPTRLPAERVIVFDEAQRAWDEAKARQGTQNKASKLTLSEPAHALEIMARLPDWGVIVALIGNGQEINTGEAGLAEWGRAIQADGRWRAIAASRAWTATDPAQRLADAPGGWLKEDMELDLTVPIRSVRETYGAAWVDALLDGRTKEAAQIAQEAGEALPFFLTRDITAWRAGLRAFTRGERRAGLLRSSGAKRLRAEGLGVEARDEIADWFLRRWPEDCRSSSALEACATEYSCQGLELDITGLAWGGDFLPHGPGWRARRFIGAKWQKDEKEYAFVRNTYRVLLTRARYETIIFVPPGDPADPTRPPAEFDALAARLIAAGIRPLVPQAKETKALPAQPPLPV